MCVLFTVNSKEDLWWRGSFYAYFKMNLGLVIEFSQAFSCLRGGV